MKPRTSEFVHNAHTAAETVQCSTKESNKKQFGWFQPAVSQDLRRVDRQLMAKINSTTATGSCLAAYATIASINLLCRTDYTWLLLFGGNRHLHLQYQLEYYIHLPTNEHGLWWPPSIKWLLCRLFNIKILFGMLGLWCRNEWKSILTIQY